MNERIETALQIGLLLLVVALLVGQALGQPVLVSYVETDSMEPTVEAGDGFLVVPAVVAGPPEPGDVIVFQAETLDGGSVTTHRVVGTTDGGHVTQGDANPFPDQQAGEPPVTDDRVLGKAVTMDGDPVVVPGLGDAIGTVRREARTVIGGIPILGGMLASAGISALSFLGVGLCLVGAGLVMGVGVGRSRDSTRIADRRESFDARRMRLALVVVLVLVGTVTMVLASGSVQYEFAVIEGGDPGDPLVLESGTAGTVTHDLANSGFAPVVVVRESDHEDVHVRERTTVIGPRSSVETSLLVEPPDERTEMDRTVAERRYVAVLPPSLLAALDGVHPWLAIVAVDVVLALLVLTGAAVAWSDQYVRVRTDGRSYWRRLVGR